MLRSEFVKLAGVLNTTCYAILGVLAIKERSAYELAQEMQHCFEYFWPRADARVYDDARRLAGLGLVTATTTRAGKRPHTTYTITAAGREALEAWLARPSRPVALEFEALVKVYLARFGTREQLLATVAQTAADAEYMLQVASTVRGVYLERCAPFQDDYVHVWQFVYDFLVDYFQLLHGWAERTRGAVEGWSNLSPEDKREAALARFQRKRPKRPRRVTGRPDAASMEPPPMPGMWRRRSEMRPGASIESTDESTDESTEAPGDAAEL